MYHSGYQDPDPVPELVHQLLRVLRPHLEHWWVGRITDAQLHAQRSAGDPGLRVQPLGAP